MSFAVKRPALHEYINLYYLLTCMEIGTACTTVVDITDE
jgi:hypothetical protein